MHSGIRLLVGGPIKPRDLLARLVLFLTWLALVPWEIAGHVFWRDEVRAFSLALSGSNLVEMLRNVHGEGHPALWYVILRIGHDVFPYREVLPVAGALIGIAAMALVAFRSPFRTITVAMILFSAYGAFEYVVISRNYGIAALVMLALAALYPHVRNKLWLGVILLVLCNTNVPSCLLAASFLLFRLIEMLTGGSTSTRREWLIFAGNCALAAVGAYLCFVTVYPTFNDEAVSSNLAHLSLAKIGLALIDSQRGFGQLPGPLIVALSCLAFVRKPAALCASLSGFLILKLFFYLVYPASYRHEILYLFFLLSLLWMIAKGAGGMWPDRAWTKRVELVGTFSFIVLLAANSILLTGPITEQLAGKPYSRSADVAKLLRQPQLAGAIVMADPDTMLESLPYYVDNPLWLLRQQRFGKVTRLTRNSRLALTVDDILADAIRLHRQTGRPIVFLTYAPLRTDVSERAFVLYDYHTDLRPESVKRFLASTRRIASLRGIDMSDENYDVYAYPR